MRKIPEGTCVSSLFLDVFIPSAEVEETNRPGMIDKKALERFVEHELEGTDYFLVNVKVSASNEIKIYIDSMGSVDIDFCSDLSAKIEAAFPREPEDYELEVGSAGFTSPFEVRKQYEKNLGNEVEVLARDGKKYTGILAEVNDDGFAIVSMVKEKPEGAKRAVEVARQSRFAYDAVNSVRYVFKF